MKIEDQCREEERMTPQNLAYFETLLTDTLEDLFREAGWAVSEITKGESREIDLIDLAMAEISRDLNLRIQTRKSRLIRKIRSALKRIEEGTYGYCERCGEPISFKRLAARPVTSKCLECKEDEERLERLTS